MARQRFEYTTLSAPVERTDTLDARTIARGAPSAVAIECTDCGAKWDYRVAMSGLDYADVTCPGCGHTEAYAGGA
jgi:predicted RNA-binding Zn-ribbon protein involved in translation (DUF1610 family)